MALFGPGERFERICALQTILLIIAIQAMLIDVLTRGAVVIIRKPILNHLQAIRHLHRYHMEPVRALRTLHFLAMSDALVAPLHDVAAVFHPWDRVGASCDVD